MLNFIKRPVVKYLDSQMNHLKQRKLLFLLEIHTALPKPMAHWITMNYLQNHNLFACCGITHTHESPRGGTEFIFRKLPVGQP